MNIKEIELLTGSIDKTLKFYTEILGFEIINSDTKTISFKAGQSDLTFNQSDNSEAKYHFAFNIPKNKLDETIEWISGKRELIKTSDDEVIADFENWNAKAVYFYDNNRNILEFIARYDLNTISEKPFDINSIISISEIGIVTDKPKVLADNLVRENQLYYFKKGPKREDFVALGNDNGLFVISNPFRNWYPTEQRAEKHFTKIKIIIDGLIKDISINEGNGGS